MLDMTKDPELVKGFKEQPIEVQNELKAMGVKAAGDTPENIISAQYAIAEGLNFKDKVIKAARKSGKNEFEEIVKANKEAGMQISIPKSKSQHIRPRPKVSKYNRG